nr:hypothetical protein Iba_chr02bCG19130 [Ipomoea batatas]
MLKYVGRMMDSPPDVDDEFANLYQGESSPSAVQLHAVRASRFDPASDDDEESLLALLQSHILLPELLLQFLQSDPSASHNCGLSSQIRQPSVNSLFTGQLDDTLDNLHLKLEID